MRGRILVLREKTPNPSLFGPVCWWGVWLTPFEKVATFAYWPDAMYFANLIALHPAVARTRSADTQTTDSKPDA